MCICGECYEDAAGSVLIPDLDAWKAEGGRGYIPPLTPESYTVTDGTAQDANGSIEFNKTSAAENDTVTVTVAPDEGYVLKRLSFYTTDPANAADITAEKSFTMPAANVTVTAEFEEIPVTIADILPEDFPTTLQTGWKTEGGNSCYMSGGNLYFMGPAYDLNFSLSEAVTLSGTDYIYDGWRNKFTFTMEDGVLQRITFTFSGYGNDWNGTYAPPAPVYTVIFGADSSWTNDRTSGLLITSDAPFAKFDSVKVDGSTTAAANYEAEEGSTKITLTPAYLKTLSVGRHSIEIVSSDGSVSTYFTIKAADAPIDPPTGDGSRIFLWIVLLLVSGGALAGITVYGKRKKLSDRQS